MAWDGDNQFTDDMDDTVTLEVTDNCDGEYAIVNVTADGGETVGIALNGESIDELVELLQTLRAGLD